MNLICITQTFISKTKQEKIKADQSENNQIAKEQFYGCPKFSNAYHRKEASIDQILYADKEENKKNKIFMF
jgi:hypothetical protein